MVLDSSTANGSIQVSSTESFVLTPSSSMSTSGPDSFVPEKFVVHSSGAVALRERFRSLPGMSKNGTSLVRSVYT